MHQSLFGIAENLETAIEVNVVSGYRQFVAAISSLSIAKNLNREILTTQDVNCVILRCKQLIEMPSDPQYENPFDVALSIYLWVLSQKCSSAAQGIAKAVLQCEQCWWAQKLALQILDAPTSVTYESASGSGAKFSVHGGFTSVAINSPYSPNYGQGTLVA
jgi:hypothetical protein